MKNEWFLDTSFALAFASAADSFHARAIAWADEVERQGIRLVTTHGVVLEIGNAFAKMRFRAAAVRYISHLLADPGMLLVPVDDMLLRKGFDLFRRRPDKEWGLVDCVSFEVMAERGITDALTADEHFSQQGFRALLRESPS